MKPWPIVLTLDGTPTNSVESAKPFGMITKSDFNSIKGSFELSRAFNFMIFRKNCKVDSIEFTLP